MRNLSMINYADNSFNNHLLTTIQHIIGCWNSIITVKIFKIIEFWICVLRIGGGYVQDGSPYDFPVSVA